MRKPTASTFRYTHLYLENWRNFARVDVDLQKRVFLIGPNASGKSNLLDVFRFLRDVVSVGGGFQAAVARRGGVKPLRCLAARRNSDIAIGVRIGNNECPSAWEYEIRFKQDSQSLPLIANECVRKNGKEILSRPNRNDKADPQRLTQTYLEQINVNKAFREVAEFFRSVRYLHIVPQLVREPDRSVGRQDDPYGGDILEQIAKTSSKTQKSWLNKITDALKVAVPQFEKIEFERDPARGTPHLKVKYSHWRPQGAWQKEDQFSDGTLRLLGLLWAVLEKRGPLLLEEPELSLHTEIVRHLPQMFGRMQMRSGRQVILSTHSSELLNEEGIAPDEILLLMPNPEGTTVQPAQDIREIRDLVRGGVPVGEAVIPHTAPETAEQLRLFEG